MEDAMGAFEEKQKPSRRCPPSQSLCRWYESQNVRLLLSPLETLVGMEALSPTLAVHGRPQQLPFSTALALEASSIFPANRHNGGIS